MMRWRRKGVCFYAKAVPWAAHTALQPTPLFVNDNVVRLYAGFRDEVGVSKIGFIDVETRDPSNVINISHTPVLDIGRDGMFDDNGVVPCSVVKFENQILLYYAGYQISGKVRFMAFSGLAISTDRGDSFIRYQETPIADRTPEAALFRAIHSIMFDGAKWRVWYGGGSTFIEGKNKTLPSYDIRYMESDSPYIFPNSGTNVLTTSGAEYRVGRPFVVRNDDGLFQMFYGFSTEASPYGLGYAESSDGISWTRKDDMLGLPSPAPGDWDEKMAAYPCFVRTKHGSYLFYNGNDYGRAGIGYAELEM